MSKTKDVLENIIHNIRLGHPELSYDDAFKYVLNSENDLGFWLDYKPLDSISKKIKMIKVIHFENGENGIETLQKLLRENKYRIQAVFDIEVFPSNPTEIYIYYEKEEIDE